MNPSRSRLAVTAMIALWCLSQLFGSVALAQTTGQTAGENSTPDRSPPVIELEAVAESVADRSQVFTAQVVDDRLLKDVTLYHRRAGQQPFTAASMSPLGDTGYYTVSVNTELNDLRTFEYYLQARDEGGNRTVSGFAFDPYKRELTPRPTPVAQAGVSDLPSDGAVASADTTREIPDVDSAESGGLFDGIGPRRRWVQVALGVLAVGALASLAGGSGDSGNPDSVDLNINLREPGT